MSVIFSAWTVIVCIIFCAVCVWAWSPKRAKEFEDAARIPFMEDDELDDAPRTPGERRDG